MRYDPTKKKLVLFDEPKYVRNRWLLDMFNRYEDYYRPEISRIIRNQRFYWGVNFGQWPAYAVEKLKLQGRTPPTYNITAKKIESQIGSYIANGFDMKYETVSGKNSDWSMNLQDMAFSDKSNCDWETSRIVALRDMHVMVGYERMVISDRYDADFGNIAWEALPPTHVYISPSWKTPYAWDIMDYFEWGMFTVHEICELYPKVADELREWKEREEITGINFGEYHGGVQKYRTTEEKWGDYHKVITFHSVYKHERKWEYDLKNRCLFPETGFDPGTKEDREIKQAYMQEVGIGEGDYTTVTQKRRIKRIEVICPSLNNEIFLAAGKDRIQTNNCNIYPIGNNFYGQFRGMVDDLHDVNVDFNKGEMNIMDIQARSAKGAMILDLALAGGSPEKRREIESQWNNPAARIWVEEGATAELGPHGGVIELKGHQPTPDMFRQTERRLDLADWLSTMPAAMDSRSQSTTESGKLFQSKVQVGLVSQKYGMKIWERHEREKAMAYPLQCKLTYAGYPREFSKSDGKGALEINTPALDASGRRVMLNDAARIPEMKVVLVPSTSGLNLRTELRAQYAETSNLLTDPKDRLLKLIFIEGIFETQDMPEEKKEEIRKAASMLIQNEALLLTLQQFKMMMEAQQYGLMPPNPMMQLPGPQQGESKEFSEEEEAVAGTLQESLPNERKEVNSE